MAVTRPIILRNVGNLLHESHSVTTHTTTISLWQPAMKKIVFPTYTTLKTDFYCTFYALFKAAFKIA